MPVYKELEYSNLPVVREDPTLKSLLEGVTLAGKMLHCAFYKSFDGMLFTKQQNPEGYISDSERIMAEAISKANPGVLIIGKTINRTEDHTKGFVWLINGIDGFDNFANGRPFCDVMAAQVENGYLLRGAVYDFIHGELFYAMRSRGSYLNGRMLTSPDREMSGNTVISYAPLVERDSQPADKKLVDALWRGMERISKKYRQFQREFQAGGIELCWVADGRLGGFASSWTTRINLTAGVLIASEAGCLATTIYGEEWKPGNLGAIVAAPKIHAVMLENLQKYLPK